VKALLAIGGEIEVATPGEVKDIVNGVGDSILSKMPRRVKPLRRRIPTSDVMPAIGACTLNFGGPTSGYTWAIIDVVIVGGASDIADRTAVANALATLYVGDTESAMLGMLLRPGVAVPAVFPFAKEYFVHFGESLFSRVYGAAATTPLSGVATVYQYIENVVEAQGI